MPTPEETAAQLEAAHASVAAAETAHAAAVKEAEENRTPEEAARDLLVKIVDHLGNQPAMERDLKVLLGGGKPKA